MDNPAHLTTTGDSATAAAAAVLIEQRIPFGCYAIDGPTGNRWRFAFPAGRGAAGTGQFGGIPNAVERVGFPAFPNSVVRPAVESAPHLRFRQETQIADRERPLLQDAPHAREHVGILRIGGKVADFVRVGFGVE